MELESLKYAWKTLDTFSAPQKKRPDPRDQERQLLALLQGRSRGPVATIRRNLTLELAVMIGLYLPLAAYYLFRFGGRLSVISLFLLAMGVLFGAYYYRMNRILREMQCPAFQVRSSLERQLRSLEKYIHADLVMGTLLIPVTACLLGVLLYWKLPPPLHPDFLHVHPGNPLRKLVLTWIAGLVLSAATMYILNKWYIGKLYGGPIQRLRELLSEMNKA